MIPYLHQPPTRSDNTVSVAQGGTATPGATKQLLPQNRVFNRIIYIYTLAVKYIYIYIYIYARSTKIWDAFYLHLLNASKDIWNVNRIFKICMYLLLLTFEHSKPNLTNSKSWYHWILVIFICIISLSMLMSIYIYIYIYIYTL